MCSSGKQAHTDTPHPVKLGTLVILKTTNVRDIRIVILICALSILPPCHLTSTIYHV